MTLKRLMVAALLAMAIPVAARAATPHVPMDAVTLLGGAKVTIGAAIYAAERAANGSAMSATLEIQHGVRFFQVMVVDLNLGKLAQVKIDAVTGKVMEIKRLEVFSEPGDQDDR